MRNKIDRRGRSVVWFLSILMMLCCVGCGNSAASDQQKGAETVVSVGTDGYVYVPEYVNGGIGIENTYNTRMYNGKIYYSEYNWDETTGVGKETYYKTTPGSEEVPEEVLLPIPEGMDVAGMVPMEDGGHYVVLRDYSAERQSEEGWAIADYHLMKADSQGTEVFRVDISKEMYEDTEDAYIQGIAADAQGNLCVACDQTVLLYNAEGAFQGKIKLDNWVQGLGTGKDGNVYITSWGNGNGLELTTVDFAAKGKGTVYQNFPSGNGNGALVSGIDHDFLVNEGSRLMGYQLATQTSEEILNWIDSDINGQYVEMIAPMEDGRIMVMIRDWSAEQTVTELAYLKKTPVSEVAQKELILIGTLNGDSRLEAAAIQFNKTNDTYRIKIKSYIDNQAEWTETTWSDAVTAMNKEIAAGNGPDIVDLSNLNIANLAGKGVLEDLTPYLEKSQKLKKEDLVPAVLDAYTYDGVLTCIPNFFTIGTVMGKTSEVGEDMGWTLDEMMAYMEANPGVEVFEGATKEQILQLCLMFNQNAFLDWENVTCSFDSEAFIKVLEFANHFPEEYEWDDISTPKKIAEGKVLLNQASVYDMDDLSVQLQFFGDEPVTFVGYPTVDGSVGNMLYGSGTYAITSYSEKKDGCYAFLESLLTDNASGNRYYMGLPVIQKELDQILYDATQPNYMRDENGEIVTDENGEPIENGYGTWGWQDGTEIEGRALTEAEAQAFKQVIESAKPVFENDTQILSLITEEATLFFEGQKTAAEAAGIIQNRVKIYISENS